MYSPSSSRSLIRSACSVVVLLGAAALGGRGAAAQQPDEALVSELARILAAADARAFDPALFGEALRHPKPLVRRQAALAAGRIGDPAAVDALVEALGDSNQGVAAAAAFGLGLLKESRAVAPLLALVRSVPATSQGPPQTEAVTALLDALQDPQPMVRAVAVRGVSRALSDTAKLAPQDVVTRIRPLLADRDAGVRVNTLRALATFRDSAFAGQAAPLAADADLNVAVAAETTLGVLGGGRAVEALQPGLTSPVFALRRQAVIALAQADAARGAAAAAPLATDADWRWRSVAAEVFGAARDRTRLEAQLADADGRVVAQALQALTHLVPVGDTTLGPRARQLLTHPDAAVRSVAADVLGRHPAVADVDRLTQAYARAAGDPFDDARLSAVSALGAIAQASADGRLAVATRFVARVPRADDYLVRRLAAERLPDAADGWGPAAPIATR